MAGFAKMRIVVTVVEDCREDFEDMVSMFREKLCDSFTDVLPKGCSCSVDQDDDVEYDGSSLIVPLLFKGLGWGVVKQGIGNLTDLYYVDVVEVGKVPYALLDDTPSKTFEEKGDDQRTSVVFDVIVLIDAAGTAFGENVGERVAELLPEHGDHILEVLSAVFDDGHDNAHLCKSSHVSSYFLFLPFLLLRPMALNTRAMNTAPTANGFLCEATNASTSSKLDCPLASSCGACSVSSLTSVLVSSKG